jgi:hypothetical protein
MASALNFYTSSGTVPSGLARNAKKPNDSRSVPDREKLEPRILSLFVAELGLLFFAGNSPRRKIGNPLGTDQPHRSPTPP